MRAAIDIETTGLHHKRDKIIGVGMYHIGPCGEHFSSFGGVSTVVEIHHSIETVYHNGKFDVKFLREAGVLCHIDHDTMVMASLLNPVCGLSLQALCQHYLGVEEWKDLDRPNMAQYSVEQVAAYCIKDCENTLKLSYKLEALLKERGLWDYYTNYLMPFYRLLAEVEQDGVALNTDLLSNLKERYSGLLQSAEVKLRETYKHIIEPTERRLFEEAKAHYKKPEAQVYYEGTSGYISEAAYRKLRSERQALYVRKVGPLPKRAAAYEARIAAIDPPKFNFDSPQQMSELLARIGVRATDKEGKATTSTKALRRYADKHPFIGEFSSYKDLVKLSQFLTQWAEMQVDGRLYGQYNVHTVRTGRLSSSEPNLQQIPKGELRNIFVPDEGNVFCVADFAQIEPRLIAHFSRDEQMIEAFRRGDDFYGLLAVKVLGADCGVNEVKEKYRPLREVAKMLTLAVLYGMGASTLDYQLRTVLNQPSTVEDARSYIEDFYSEFAAVRRFKERIGYLFTDSGHLDGWFGRRLYLPKEDSRHKALNYFIQNAASELTTFSQCHVQKELRGIAKLRLLVHDEVVYECAESAVEATKAALQRNMVDGPQKNLLVPLAIEVAVGPTWGVKK